MRIKTLVSRRLPLLGEARRPRTAAAVRAQSSPLVAPDSPPADARWQAIVAQLLATPSDPEPFQAWPDSEYAFARRLGIHINRAPRRR